MQLQDPASPGSPADLVDLARYPITDLGSEPSLRLLQRLRRDRVEKGVVLLEGFLKPRAVEAIASEVRDLRPRAHREDVSVGTPCTG